MTYVCGNEGGVYFAPSFEAARQRLVEMKHDLVEYRLLGAPDGSWLCFTEHDPRTDPFLCALVSTPEGA